MSISRFAPKPLSKRFAGDETGIAAVEFGMIVPLLLVMLLGTIELSRAVVMARRFNFVTAMASDLIARESAMSDSDMSGVEKAVTTAWAPFTLPTLKLQVVAVRAAANGATAKPPGSTYVDWSYSILSAPVIAGGTPYALPANMLSNGTSTIIVNATYTYTTLFGGTIPGMTLNTSWTASSSHSPRNLCVQRPPARNDCLSIYE
jgi:Flp pilus assembly protein TadG